MKKTGPDWFTSSTETIFGCDKRAAAIPSRKNRSRSSGVKSTSGCGVLSAIFRRAAGSQARNTIRGRRVPAPRAIRNVRSCQSPESAQHRVARNSAPSLHAIRSRGAAHGRSTAGSPRLLQVGFAFRGRSRGLPGREADASQGPLAGPRRAVRVVRQIGHPWPRPPPQIELACNSILSCAMARAHSLRGAGGSPHLGADLDERTVLPIAKHDGAAIILRQASQRRVQACGLFGRRHLAAG